MARIRTVKPEIWVDEKFVELSPFARLLFIGLWNFVDDYGRVRYSAKRLKLQIFPADDVDVAALVEEMQRLNLVTVYAVDQSQYLQVNGFCKHQRIDKRFPSKCPAPAGATAGEQTSRVDVEAHEFSPTLADSRQCSPDLASGMDQVLDQGGELKSDVGSCAANPHPVSRSYPDCPHQQIIGLYHELLPMCPQVKDWTPARAAQLRARWNEDPSRQNLDYWRRFFEYVRTCGFLIGVQPDSRRRSVLCRLGMADQGRQLHEGAGG